MSKRPLAMLAIVLAGVACVGCRASAPATADLPILDSKAAETVHLTTQEASEARRIYTAKCARCHRFYDPASYNETEWHAWIKSMSRKARLTSHQEEVLGRYTALLRERRYDR